MTAQADFQASNDPVEGARNLLIDCADVSAGDRVLLLVEPPGSGHYDDAMGGFISDQARNLGAHPQLLEVALSYELGHVPAAVMEAISQADRTIFLARVGDQLRFQPLPGAGRKVMSYALDFGFLGAPFATQPHGFLAELHRRLTARLAAARTCAMTCPQGTDLTLSLSPLGPVGAPGGFTVATFPVMIVPPLSAAGASGRLVLTQALTSTYIDPYPDSILPLPAPLALILDEGVIVDFEGDSATVEQAKAQFARVGGLFGGSPLRVNSWHAGVNPMTFYPRPALDEIDRWSSLAFGSPRYAHFHMCGPAPGEICGQVFDPTIAFDGDTIWDQGQLAFLDAPDNLDLLASHGVDASAYRVRQDIGVAGLSNSRTERP